MQCHIAEVGDCQLWRCRHDFCSLLCRRCGHVLRLSELAAIVAGNGSSAVIRNKIAARHRV